MIALMDITEMNILDTASEVEALKVALLAKMPPQDKILKFAELWVAARSFLKAGIIARHPGCLEVEMRNRVAAIVLGRDFVVEHYNWDPEVMGY